AAAQGLLAVPLAGCAGAHHRPTAARDHQGDRQANQSPNLDAVTSPLPINFSGRVFGVNLVPRAGDGKPGDWESHWADFPTIWPDWRKQIDNAYGLGANAIRIIGTIIPVVNGTITQSQYSSYW